MGKTHGGGRQLKRLEISTPNNIGNSYLLMFVFCFFEKQEKNKKKKRENETKLKRVFFIPFFWNISLFLLIKAHTFRKQVMFPSSSG